MDRKIRKVSVGQSIFSDGPRDHSGIMDYSRQKSDRIQRTKERNLTRMRTELRNKVLDSVQQQNMKLRPPEETI